ncbi:unnamed protein product [Caenorhabditis brenneri]
MVRWKDGNLSASEINEKISALGCGLSNSKELKVSDVCVLVLLNSEKEIKRLCKDVHILEAGYSINPLVDLNGMHLRDVNDILRTLSIEEKLTDDDLMKLFVTLLCLEVPEREAIAAQELKIIEHGISEIIENSLCTTFGSYSSPVRRNGYSDIDLAVSSIPKDSCDIRPLRMIIEDPKCLIEKPLTYSELVSFPAEEIIKAIFKCLSDNELFREKFEMRTLLVRTPIVVFKSRESPEMKLSYDVSVNNQISVEKSNILSEFISKDSSNGNKMRHLAMFFIHWSRTNKLLGGVYSDEKVEKKLKFNSYILHHMIIHFVQTAANVVLLNTSEKPENRVMTYNFDDIFHGYAGCLRELFSYYLNFDYENMGIFGSQVIEKSKLAVLQNVEISPFMLVDPLDVTHNISDHVFPEGIQLLQKLMKRSLEKMTKRDFNISDLLPIA